MYFDVVRFQMSNYAWMSNFWCHFLIDGLLTNQIALLLGNIFGNDCRWFLSPHLVPLLNHPPPHFNPIFLLTPGVLLRFLSISISPPGKERKRLLRWLGETLLQTAWNQKQRRPNLGDGLYITIIYNIPNSWVNSLNGYNFFFDLIWFLYSTSI